MRYLLLSVLVACVIGIMVPSAFAAPTSLSDFKKFIPDYYNYEAENSTESSTLVYLEATINKGDGKVGGVKFMRYVGNVDPETIWNIFKDFKESSSLYNVRDHIPDLPPTCYEGLTYPPTPEWKRLTCIKDNVMITVDTNYGETRSIMKQILNKMDGQLSLPDIEGGGCLIATATFGSEMAPQVQFLRELRDNTVLQTESGTSFMTGFNQFYYSFSPTIADYERENSAFKEAVKITLTPLLTSLTLLQYADIDSESEMLGYGIGVILLNIGMYFVAPAVLIMAVRKRV